MLTFVVLPFPPPVVDDELHPAAPSAMATIAAAAAQAKNDLIVDLLRDERASLRRGAADAAGSSKRGMRHYSMPPPRPAPGAAVGPWGGGINSPRQHRLQALAHGGPLARQDGEVHGIAEA